MFKDTALTSGDMIFATASAITNGNIVKLGQGGNSAFSGNGLYMDFDNTGGGGGTFTGNFIKFDNATTTKFTVDASGNVGAAGVGQFGSTTTAAYSRFGSTGSGHTGVINSAGDLLISGDLEMDGKIYLDGRTIANPAGTTSILLPVDPTITPAYLTASNWIVENSANVGQAALMVNQTKQTLANGDIFTASFSGIPKFTIHNDSSFTTTGLTSAPTDNLLPGTVYYQKGVSFYPDRLNTLETSLQAYWKLDETSGTRSDSYGTNHLTENGTGGVGYAAGKVSNAADFESSDSDYLEINDNAALSTGDIDFTIAAWAKLESTTGANEVVMSKTDSASVSEYELDYSNADGKFAFILYNSSGPAVCTVTDTQQAVSPGTWYFITAWHDATGDTCNIQVNNNTAVSAAETGTVSDTAAKFRIGARRTSGNLFFDGLIDEAGFWKKFLQVKK